MSQPRDSDQKNDDLLEPIADLSELWSVFTRFEKARPDFRVGVEHERFVVDPQTLLPIKWQTPQGVHALMRNLLRRFSDQEESVSGVSEDDQLIAIMRKASSITLEPGGQVELSGAPLASIFDVDTELANYQTILSAALGELGLNSLLMGFHPIAKRSDFEFVPKQRYQIMRSHMLKTGTRGHDMMLRTCTVQANFDYSGEDDMIASFRVALLASPIVTALFAASPFKEGRPGEFLSERTMVWHETDPARCGFPLEVFKDTFSYRTWVERVLDTPMYFVRRNGVYHEATSITFRQFMQNGFSGFTASVRDFEDHLTTIFTDARIKPQLEVRGADCGPQRFLRALPAFWKGLLYDEPTRDKTLTLLSKLSPADLTKYQIEAARHGVRASLGKYKLDSIAGDLLELSNEGLKRRAQKNAQGQDESIFLTPLYDVVHNGKNIAQDMLERYEKSGGSFAWLLNPQ